MSHLFRNSSPGALTLQQSVAQAKKRLIERGLQMRQARALAAQGRGHDTEIAHVAIGEIVLPKALQTRGVLDSIRQAAVEANIPLDRLRIGSGANSINPETGMPEFGEVDDSYDNYLPGVPDMNIAVPGDTPSRPSSPPGIGTLPLPTDPTPSDRLPAPGIGTMPIRPDSASAYSPRLGPGIGTLPLPNDTSAADISDFNPIKNYPAPGYTALTSAKPEIHQGSGAFESYRRTGQGKDSWHTGVDFEVPSGTNVVAPGDGVVINTTPLDGYGNQIAIRHANGFTSQVAHLGSINVKPGDKVTAGQVIGVSGADGNAKGKDPQVHFEVRGGSGKPRANGGIIFNPGPYLP